MTEERRKEWALHIRAIVRDPAPEWAPDLVLAALESFEREVAVPARLEERARCKAIASNAMRRPIDWFREP